MFKRIIRIPIENIDILERIIEIPVTPPSRIVLGIKKHSNAKLARSAPNHHSYFKHNHYNIDYTKNISNSIKL